MAKLPLYLVSAIFSVTFIIVLGYILYQGYMDYKSYKDPFFIGLSLILQGSLYGHYMNSLFPRFKYRIQLRYLYCYIWYIRRGNIIYYPLNFSGIMIFIKKLPGMLNFHFFFPNFGQLESKNHSLRQGKKK